MAKPPDPAAKNPWQTLSTELEFENAWFVITTHDTVAPDGSRPRYGKISFKNRAVAVIPLDTDQHTWLVGQWRFPLGEYSWELPMGGAPKDEDPLAAAKRELQEETGLDASHWTELMFLHVSNSITDEEARIYVATGLTEGDTEFEETEDLEVRKLPFTEALRMALNGEITDALTVVALLRYAEHTR